MPSNQDSRNNEQLPTTKNCKHEESTMHDSMLHALPNENVSAHPVVSPDSADVPLAASNVSPPPQPKQKQQANATAIPGSSNAVMPAFPCNHPRPFPHPNPSTTASATSSTSTKTGEVHFLTTHSPHNSADPLNANNNLYLPTPNTWKNFRCRKPSSSQPSFS